MCFRSRLSTLTVVVLLYCGTLSSGCTSQKRLDNTPYRFDHFAMQVQDVDATVEWLQKVFGLPEVYDGTEQEHIRWLSFGDEQTIHVIGSQGAQLTKVLKAVHLAVRTKDLDAFILHLSDHAIPYESWVGNANEISVRPDMMRQVYVLAPGGYYIEVNGK